MNAEILPMLRQRKVVLSVIVALVVLLIWFVAVFSREGHKLAAVNTSVQQAQSEQSSLLAHLALLKLYSKESATFEQLSDRLSAAVPSTIDIYDYITAISNAASSTGVAVQSVNPSTAVSAGSVGVIPVAVAVKGSYDQTLAFIKALYALPRLTVITQITISGGGTSTSRSTPLSDQFSLDIFAQPSAIPSSTNS
jgi:Tfp pilus assembly protein PilO